MDWTGYYINLDRSPARREAIERQLSVLGLTERYKRFAAVDGKRYRANSQLSGGEIGIFQSHLELIRLAASLPTLTHVLEDDVLLSRHTGPFLDTLAGDAAHEKFDLIVTDTGVAPDMRQYAAFRKLAARNASSRQEDSISLLDISTSYSWGMTSYILSPNGAKRLLWEAEEEWKKGPLLPIDIVLAQAVEAGHLSIGCSFPFVTWLDMPLASRSLAERRPSPLTTVVNQLARYPFYIERDLNGFLVPVLRQLIARATAAGGMRDAKDAAALNNARLLLAECGSAAAPQGQGSR